MADAGLARSTNELHDGTLTRADLADIVHRKLGLSRAESASMVERLLYHMCHSLSDGNNVKISGFGSFILRDKGSGTRMATDAHLRQLGFVPGAVLELVPGERILEGARRLGYECPQSCRNGNCHVCAALLVEGRVEQAGDVRDHGEFYTCIAEPLEDCIVLWDGVLALGELPVRTLSCQVTSCTEVGGDTWRVRLRAPAGPSQGSSRRACPWSPAHCPPARCLI